MQKILIVGPAWIGDMVMAQSLFKFLKQQAADTEIHVLAPPWSITILERMPEVAATIQMPLTHGQLGLRTRRALGHQLRPRKFQRAIVLPGSFKSALVPWFAKIPKRSGYVGEQRWGLLNDIRRLNRAAMPMNVQRCVGLALPALTTTALPMADIPRPKLVVQHSAANQTASRFGLTTTDLVVALCPGAEYGEAKQWPAEHFAQVANQQLKRGRQVWLFGSKNDSVIAGRINQLCAQHCVDLTGRTTLSEAIDLLSLAKYVVTNDSGLLHIAAAVGCQVIAIYGSSSATFTPPLTENCTCISLHLSCSPCFQRTCPLGHLNCLKQLPAEMVLANLG